MDPHPDLDVRFRCFLIGLPCFLAVLVVVSAVSAPWVFEVVEMVAPDRWPFKRVFNRVLMITAVLALVPWLIWMRAGSWRAVGLDSFRGCWRGLLLGWGAGMAHVGLLTVVHLIGGARVWHLELDAGRFVGYVASGMAVGLIEEFIFRGGLFLSLRQLAAGRLIVVAVLGSIFFAFAHFPQARELGGGVDVWSGWRIWGDMAAQFLDFHEILRRWFGLLLVGLVLCVAAWRSGSLWLAIGIHAGWVCGIKSVNRLSDATAAAQSFWWGGHPLDGVVAWGFLVALGWILWTYGGRLRA